MNETVPFHRQCSDERISRRPRRFHCRGCTQLRQSRATGKAGHRWQRRHRTRPVRRRHPADLPRVVRRRGAARRSRRPRVPLRARAEFDPTAAVADDADAGPDEALSPADLLGNSRTLFAGAFAVVFALVTFEGLYYRGTLTYLPRSSTGWRRSKRWRFRPASRGSSRPTTSTSSGCWSSAWGPVCRRKLTNRVPPARGLAAIFAVLAVLALAFVPVTTMDAGLGVTVALCGVLGFFSSRSSRSTGGRPSASGLTPRRFTRTPLAIYTPPDARGLSYGYTYLAKFGIGSLSIAVGGSSSVNSRRRRFDGDRRLRGRRGPRWHVAGRRAVRGHRGCARGERGRLTVRSSVRDVTGEKRLFRYAVELEPGRPDVLRRRVLLGVDDFLNALALVVYRHWK